MKSISFLRNVAAIVACLAVSIMFAGCEKDDALEAITVADSGSLTQEVFADNTQGKSGVSFTTAGAWTSFIEEVATTYATTSSGWVSISPSSGDAAGNYTVSITLSPNTTGANRTAIITISCQGIDINISVTQKGTKQDGTVNAPTELTSPITANTTLKDLGMDIDYVYNGNSLLKVNNNATLTIEPGVTIRFTKSGGGFQVESGAVVKAVGTSNKRIRFEGAIESKGSWDYIYLNTTAEHQFEYCDFVNGGNRTSDVGVIYLLQGGLQLKHSRISGSKNNGLWVGSETDLVFTDNVIENCDNVPVFLSAFKQIAAFDATSDMTDNPHPYISVYSISLEKFNDVVVHKTSVPYYVRREGGNTAVNSQLTINAGVTFYMAENAGIWTGYGQILINGTADEPVLFTRLPGASYYWHGSNGGGIRFYQDVNHIFKYCIFEYGGANEDDGGILDFASGSSATLENVTIRHARTYGIWLDAANISVKHKNVKFEDCPSGNVFLRANGGRILTALP